MRPSIVAALVGVLLLCAHCGGAQPVRRAASGVSIRRITRAVPAARPGAVALAPGDFVIEAGDLRVVVGGVRRPSPERAVILEATREGMPVDDGIVLLATRFVVAGRMLRLSGREMSVIERDGAPALRIEGVLRIDRREVPVVREIRVPRIGGGVALATRIDLPDDAPPLRDVSVATRIGWGGALPFLPGHGLLEDAASHEASFVARGGEQVSATFAYRDAPARVRATWEQHGASRFLLHTDALAPPRTVEPGGTFTERAVLLLARGGMGEGVRRVGWWRGHPFPETSVHLPYAPDGAQIRVSTTGGRPLLVTPPGAAGHALVPIPPISDEASPDHAVIVADAYGHAPSDPIRVTGRRGEHATLVIPEGGRIRVTALDGATGLPMPARIRIVGIDPPKSPDLGPDWVAAGAGDTVITVEGDAVIPLPPGRWRVIVTRGPEWTLVEETVDVTETFRPHVRATLEHVVDPGEWVASDFHLHAAPSPDSQVTLDDRLASLLAEGIRFAVPTDHNRVTDYAPIAAGMGIADFGTITGVEVTTWEPHFGHFNAYPYPRDPALPNDGAPPWLATTPAQLFDRLHAVDPDTVVQINHPRMEGEIGYFERMNLDPATGAASDLYRGDFDVLEVWNGFDLARPESLSRVMSDWYALLRRGQRVVGVGNSDSHLVRYQWAGYPRTYVQVPDGSVTDPRAIVRALRGGHAFVTSGPFLEATIDGRGPGDVVVPQDGRVSVRVRVQAPSWIDVSVVEVWVDGELAVARPVPVPNGRRGRPSSPVRFDDTIEVPVPARGFVIVMVRGDRPLDVLLIRAGIPPLAFTNPIWIDAAAPIAQDAGPVDASGR